MTRPRQMLYFDNRKPAEAGSARAGLLFPNGPHNSVNGIRNCTDTSYHCSSRKATEYWAFCESTNEKPSKNSRGYCAKSDVHGNSPVYY